MKSSHPLFPFLRLALLPSFAVTGSLLRGADARVDFNRDIRPIISNACIRCHGPDEHERKGGDKEHGGLRLDTQAGAFQKFSDGTAAVVPGNVAQSQLLVRILSHDPEEVMPPLKTGKKLSDREINLLKQWIQQGGSYAKHWSYEPIQKPTVPSVAGVTHPVDSFIRQRLVAEGLSPQPEADKATLARRAALDVTGLPPQAEMLATFLNDSSPQAYEHYVDQLLASAHYGEHWAREWLDLARYADSAGYADDPSRSIWAFRDYVIRSYNANKPFDQFTIEQLAGDLLPNPGDEELTATAFHRNTMTNSEGGTNDEEFRSAAIVDRVNTTMAVWMGTSMACAQCHTHKYDPLTQKEYFQLYAFLNNTADADRRDESPLHSFLTNEQKAESALLTEDIAKLEQKFQPAQASAAQKTAATAWFQTYLETEDFRPLKPTLMQSQAGLPISASPDGSIAVTKSAAKDTYTMTFAFPQATVLHGLQLETLPQAGLPGHGAGHGGGNFVLTHVGATVEPPSHNPGPKARFVRVELPGNGKMLQLAEVEVFQGSQNLARKGKATQANTYTDAVASRANDGNTDGEYTKGSVAHTSGEGPDPWWEVDLQSEQAVDRVVVWNRTEAPERLEGFKLVLLDAQRKPVWEKAGNAAAPSIPFALTGAVGVSFSDAVADFTQSGFSEASILSDSPEPAAPKGKKKANKAAKENGWAVGGSIDKPHRLALKTSLPVTIPAGSTLRLTLEQNSPYPDHLLGQFRLSYADQASTLRKLDLPPNLAALASAESESSRAKGRTERLTKFLAKESLDSPEAVARQAAQLEEILSYYLAEVAPDLTAERKKVASLKDKVAAFKPTTVPIYQELPAGQRRKTHVQLRGSYNILGDEVSEGVPAVFPPLPQGAAQNRLTLAKWLVDPQNPLTPRVIANRYWESLFGIGIVRTSEEFGSQGETPSHPELLDFLATELLRTKWDLKQFVKLLVTSASYRQSSKVTPALLERDPDNRLLARGPRFRLTGEMVRDQALAVSGLLSDKMFGPSVRPERPNMGLSAAFGGGLDWQTSTGEDRFRRGLYTEWRRTSPYPSLTTFDAPNREVCSLRRSRTNTPLQAFVLLNDPVFVEAAQALGRKLVKAAATPEDRIQQGFQAVLNRVPSSKESARILLLAQETLAKFQANPQQAEDLATKPIGPLPPGAQAVELATWTTVASVLLNLDETLMKR